MASRIAALYHGNKSRAQIRYLSEHAMQMQRLVRGHLMRNAVLALRRRIRDGAIVDEVYKVRPQTVRYTR